MIDIQDIAHALSLTCRFNGHTKEFYSVAQHCYLASYLCEKDIAIHVLLHDAAEAYVGDMVSPLKDAVGHDYKQIENKILSAIYEKFGIAELSSVGKRLVKQADLQILQLEAECLLPTKPIDNWSNKFCVLSQSRFTSITPWCPDTAKFMFLMRFEELLGGEDGFYINDGIVY